ncbi:class II fructose-bisphosphate aldolase [Anaerotruncus rubiinfantis]|uniref:class II fructose-bisphosphate aldolase n=1 Tax=Anaerotruncus rubiinfantis TaxID=1720200 RepID=UPI00189B106D|nr:class II fructose-bisphosphate aldolase [Anaerotruncus rubiinfantis]
MAIVTPEKVYRRCLNDRWAVGGFIGYNLEIMEAAVKAAVDVKAPIMVQASCRVIDYAGADVLYAMAKAYSKRYHTDLILHLDHGDTVERCIACIENGFSSVMLDCAEDPFEENLRKTREVVEYAHRHGAFVEGEVFHPVASPERFETSPEEAVEYVKRTGCDSLAVCCGNAHDIDPLYPKKLHIGQIRKIHEALPEMPLVLHATSIFPDEFIDRANAAGACREKSLNFTLADLQASFQYGVCKVNSALDVKILFTTAIREYMLRNPPQIDPRGYLGYAREEIRKYIAHKHRHVFLDDQKV